MLRPSHLVRAALPLVLVLGAIRVAHADPCTLANPGCPAGPGPCTLSSDSPTNIYLGAATSSSRRGSRSG